MAHRDARHKDDLQEHSRDLKALRRLSNERTSVQHDSTEWLALERREDALTRKIRDWASRSVDEGASTKPT